MAAYAAAIAAVLEIGQSVLGGKSKRRGQHKLAKRMRRMANISDSLQGGSLGQQEALARLATQQQLGGYDTARKEAGRLGRGAKRSALDRETQLMGRASQSMANRGLGSTTIGANLSRGIASDTNRSLADVDEGLAGLFGNLAIGRGNVEAAGSQALAGLSQKKADLFEKNAAMRTFGHMFGASPYGGNGPIPDSGPSGLESILGGLQTGLGAYMGQGGGGQQGGGFNPQEYMMYLYDQQQNGLGHYPAGGQSPWGYGGMGR